LKHNKIILTILVKHKRRILLRGKKEKENLATQTTTETEAIWEHLALRTGFNLLVEWIYKPTR
jgi:hypothetical protein